MKKNLIQEIRDLDLTTEEGIAAAINLQKMKSRAEGFQGKGLGSGSVVINKSTKSNPVEPPVTEDVTELEVPEEAVEKSAPETPAPTVTPADINKMINDAIAPVIENAKVTSDRLSEAEAENRSLKEELAQAQAQLVQAEKAQRIVDDLGKFAGRPVAPTEEKAVNVNTQWGGGKMSGAVAEWHQEMDKTLRRTKMTTGGQVFSTGDYSSVRGFVRENKDHLRRDLEAYGRSLGLFQGSRSLNYQQNRAITVAADIVGGFLPVLSSIMRENNRPGYIFHQFCNYRLDPTKGEGDTIKIPRAAYQPAPTDPNSRLLSGNGVFNRIVDGSQSISTGTVNSVVQEWGLGREPGAEPIGLANFVSSYSMIELEALLYRNLYQDYIRWEDLKIRSLWSPTSLVVYNDAGNVTTTVGDVTASDDGSFTEDFIYSVTYKMAELNIPPLADQCYGMAVPMSYIKNLRKSLDDKLQVATTSELMDVTNLLNVMTGGYVDKVSGYIGKIGNAHIWQSNAFSNGVAGTEGVNSQTIGGGTNITREGFAFGGDTIGCGIGSEYEIRFDDNTDFQRMRRAIWHKEASYAAIDVDPTGYNDTSDVPQQLRVLKMRCTDNPL